MSFRLVSSQSVLLSEFECLTIGDVVVTLHEVDKQLLKCYTPKEFVQKVRIAKH